MNLTENISALLLLRRCRIIHLDSHRVEVSLLISLSTTHEHDEYNLSPSHIRLRIISDLRLRRLGQ